MKYDVDKLDEVILALLYLNYDESGMAWKSFPWGSMDRLHEKGLISNPRSKNKSVYLTEEAFKKAETLLEKIFK